MSKNHAKKKAIQAIMEELGIGYQAASKVNDERRAAKAEAAKDRAMHDVEVDPDTGKLLH